jgi:germination protein M
LCESDYTIHSVKRLIRRKLAKIVFRLVLLTVILIMVVWGLWSAASCMFGGRSRTENVNLFFYDDIIGSLTAVPSEIDSGNLYRNIIEALIGGPSSDTFTQPTLNPKTRLISLEIEEKNAVVNLSDNVKELISSMVSEKNTAYSIINTLLLLPGIDSVTFQIEGKKPTVLSESFDISGVFTEPLDSDVAIQTCRLYFPEKRGRFLAIEYTLVRETTDTAETAKLLARRFIQGPISKDLYSYINHETKVLEAKLNQSLLTLDLSAQILQSNMSASAETMFLRSLTLTMTELTGVRSVQLLINGEKVDELFGHHSYNNPFTRWDESRLFELQGIGNPTLVYFACESEDGEYHIVPCSRMLSVAGEVLPQLLNYLLDGPTPTELENTIVSCIPDGTEATLKREGNEVKLNLMVDTKLMKNRAYEQAFIQQILMTLTETNRDSGILTITINDMIQETLPYGTAIQGGLTR